VASIGFVNLSQPITGISEPTPAPIATPQPQEVTEIDDSDQPLAAIDSDRMLDEIIIKFHDRSQFPGKEKQYDDEVAKVLKDQLSLVTENVYVVKAQDLSKNPNAVLNRYKNSAFIDYVEPNYLAELSIEPNDPNYKAQKASLTAINAQAGWDIVTGGGPAVAIVDTGVAQVADLPKLLPGYSADKSLSPNSDTMNHGTAVAGTVGAIGNNGIGGAGINWNAGIMPVKADNADGKLPVANVAMGIRWAADNGARVINMSLGLSYDEKTGKPVDSETLRSAVDYAYGKGCVLIASAGNSARSPVEYPAGYDNVLGVGGSANGKDRAANLSCYGPGLDILALSTYNTTLANGTYANASGTSFSAPQAAGLATLVLALQPGMSPSQVYDCIRQGAKTLNGDRNDTGYGLIDIGKTLALAQAFEPSVEDSSAMVGSGNPGQPQAPAFEDLVHSFAKGTLQEGAYEGTGGTLDKVRSLGMVQQARANVGNALGEPDVIQGGTDFNNKICGLRFFNNPADPMLSGLTFEAGQGQRIYNYDHVGEDGQLLPDLSLIEVTMAPQWHVEACDVYLVDVAVEDISKYSEDEINENGRLTRMKLGTAFSRVGFDRGYDTGTAESGASIEIELDGAGNCYSYIHVYFPNEVVSAAGVHLIDTTDRYVGQPGFNDYKTYNAAIDDGFDLDDIIICWVDSLGTHGTLDEVPEEFGLLSKAIREVREAAGQGGGQDAGGADDGGQAAEDVRTLTSATTPKLTSVSDLEVSITVTESFDDGSTKDVSYMVAIEKNGQGKVSLGDGSYSLMYDVKGNGSNIKAWEITMN